MGCMSSKAHSVGDDRHSNSDGHRHGTSNGYTSHHQANGSFDDRDLGSQSDFPVESSVAADVGTNLEGRSEAAFSRSSGGDDAATDVWSTQNDEIAPHVASPDDSARHDSFVSTPTDMSRDENWATRSTAASSTAGEGTLSAH